MTEDSRIPDLWWSPSKREVYWLPEPASVNVWTLELVDESLPADSLPSDAVRLTSASPLPDSETEWGRRWPGPNVVQEFGRSREDAENACYPNTQLVRREVGPWIEVQP